MLAPKSSLLKPVPRLHLATVIRLSRATYRLYTTNPIPESAKDKSRPLYQRLSAAWKDTPTKWYPLPLAVGALLLVAIDYRKNHTGKEVHLDEHGNEVVKLKGPWQVHVLGALPLRNLSRLWGYLNSLELPVWFRPFGFRLYSYIFGCNLDEIENTDLTQYKSLGDFFYRRLKDGVRPIADSVLVSPADGKVLHFGTISDLHVEQVKGITYSLDAFLGVENPSSPSSTVIEIPKTEHHDNKNHEVVTDEEFANVNGIQYSLGNLLGSGSTKSQQHQPRKTPTSTPSPSSSGTQTPDQTHLDPSQSVQDNLAHDATVAYEMGVRPALRRRSTSGSDVQEGHALNFVVIYLAPGDYHRFHSPTAWIVQKRRHFVGELFSVSPYMAKRLQNLFVLNERVALLGRWKHGFFGMVPVGATNVGSIKINFDSALRTNELHPRRSHPPPGTYTEATYSSASPILGGKPLNKGEEMGGFCLGSTVVLVFEAPLSFEFKVGAGQKVKVGEVLGDVKEDVKA
ncbi:hypothetical protein JAAARDRAFT_62535 [Jaapia argillacea MUCL 33604]|uniref:Phosphatidylserine decarboxylase proenzyme 1, mitochondrial n=1 Tax=Jaapia argillacea MUCL 33604 TaxID=933084 RepID=A0A067P959_9AGAM|nr:hypothetical protein JAAARDRAFT_62535 [Jaapia argillacea MUCL 33604]